MSKLSGPEALCTESARTELFSANIRMRAEIFPFVRKLSSSDKYGKDGDRITLEDLGDPICNQSFVRVPDRDSGEFFRFSPVLPTSLIFHLN